MAVLDPALRTKFIDKEWLRKQFDALHEQQNYARDRHATAEKARQMIAEDLDRLGISPNDRIFSRGIIEMRNVKYRVAPGRAS